MKNEKTMNNEVIETEFVERPEDVITDYEDCDDYYENDKIISKVIKAGVGTVLAVGGGVAIKQREKIKTVFNNRVIKSLENKGYTVLDPDYQVIYEDDDSENVEKEDKK